MSSLDDLMLAHVKAILHKDEPSIQELELVRKFLNDRRNRSFEDGLHPLDPTATAMKLYGNVEFDELPLTLDRLNNGSYTEDHK